MVHVSISDIINDDSSAEVEDMVSNCDKVKKIYVTKNVCLLGLVFTNWTIYEGYYYGHIIL